MDPRAPRSRVLEAFPYPIAYPYAQVLDGAASATTRCESLDFTVYQLLRLVCLPLVSQYLRQPGEAATAGRDPVGAHALAINRSVAAIRCPFFSSWISLAHALAKHLPQASGSPLFPELGPALAALKTREERPVGLRGQRQLAVLEAILALRNRRVHGGLREGPDHGAAAAELLDYYLPVLHAVLDAFAFLGDVELTVCDGEWPPTTGHALVRVLRGARLDAPREIPLTSGLEEALAVSPAVLTGPGDHILPLDPLISRLVGRREPIYLYDGHFSARGDAGSRTERNVITYLGISDWTDDAAAGARLRRLFEERRVAFYLDRVDTKPWTIIQSALDASRRTLEDLVGAKYFPECHVARPAVESEVTRFLAVPPRHEWPATCDRRRYRNSLVLAGPVGSGKTALLASQVAALLGSPTERIGAAESTEIVLFLRGDALRIREAEGVALFRDVGDRLGIAMEGARLPGRKPQGGFSSFRELLDHLHAQWNAEAAAEGRFILVLDALNEAPHPESALLQALDLVGEAARYPWFKVLLSLRQEWLTIWTGRLGAQERSPLDTVREALYVPARPEVEGRPGLPVLFIEPLTSEETAEAYGRYQAAARGRGTDAYRVPACPTPWAELPADTRDLLRTPLHLHLFMSTFDGVPAESVRVAPELFRRHIDHTLQGRPGLERAVDAVVGRLLADLRRPSAELDDDDAHAIRQAWVKQLPAEDRPAALTPVEALAYEGLIVKRVREEGSGHRFVFQAVAEYLIYRSLDQTRPPGEDELAYWRRHAALEPVFPEYAGAFGMLLRDRVARGRFDWIGSLVKGAPSWIQDRLVSVLLEVARAGHAPGRASPTVEAVAAALAQTAGSAAAWALVTAGTELAGTAFALSALPYLRVGCRLASVGGGVFGVLDLSQAIFLIESLTRLGNALDDAGAVDEAVGVYHQAIAIYEAHPVRAALDAPVARALSELATLLRRTGGAVGLTTARELGERAVALFQTRWEAAPGDGEVGRQLAWALGTLGSTLDDLGHADDAVARYSRAIEILDGLATPGPAGAGVRRTLARVLSDLGITRHRAGQLEEAAQALRRAVAIRETEWAAAPDNVVLGQGLLKVLTTLGAVLVRCGEAAEGHALLVRAVDVHQRLARDAPQAADWARERAGLMLEAAGRLREVGDAGEAARALALAVPVLEAQARVAHEQAALLRKAERVDDAARAFTRCVELRHLLWSATPADGAATVALMRVSNELASYLATVDRDAGAEQYGRLACALAERVWPAHRQNADIGLEVYKAHLFLGVLLRDTNRREASLDSFAQAERAAAVLTELAPGHVGFLAARAQALVELGRAADAQRLVHEVLSQDPRHPWGLMLKKQLDA